MIEEVRPITVIVNSNYELATAAINNISSNIISDKTLCDEIKIA